MMYGIHHTFSLAEQDFYLTWFRDNLFRFEAFDSHLYISLEFLIANILSGHLMGTDKEICICIKNFLSHSSKQR